MMSWHCFAMDGFLTNMKLLVEFTLTINLLGNYSYYANRPYLDALADYIHGCYIAKFHIGETVYFLGPL